MAKRVEHDITVTVRDLRGVYVNRLLSEVLADKVMLAHFKRKALYDLKAFCHEISEVECFKGLIEAIDREVALILQLMEERADHLRVEIMDDEASLVGARCVGDAKREEMIERRLARKRAELDHLCGGHVASTDDGPRMINPR